MKVVKKGRYILHAPWHSHNGKEVEVIMKRKGLSDSFKGQQIFHVAFDPDDEFRSENLDEEFLAEHFRELEEMFCVLDTTMADEDTIEKFKPYYKILKTKMQERINVVFKERHAGDPELVHSDYLCIFYLVADSNGNLGLILDRDNNGEIMVIKEEQEKEVKEEKIEVTTESQRRKK
jgi:hypothetical protein